MVGGVLKGKRSSLKTLFTVDKKIFVLVKGLYILVPITGPIGPEW